MGKKRSFVKCQKRNAKRGKFGRGVELDEETFSYFIRIMGEINHCKHEKKEEEKDSLEILASNVFKEIENNEITYSSNQVGSRVIEQLLPYTTDEQFFKFVEVFTSDIRPLCTDPYSSHVLQGSVLTAFKRYFAPDSQSKESYFNYALRIGKFLLNNIDDFALDQHANHIIRVVLSGLTAKPVNNLLDELPKIQESDVKIPDEFHELLVDYVNRVLACPQFDDYCNDSLTSALVQSLLITTARVDIKLKKKLMKRILGNFNSQPLDLENERSASVLRLLEVVLTVADEKRFKKIYEQLFKGKLKMFACHKTGNFAVQKLLTNCKDKELFEEMYSVLADIMGEILECRNAGVILSLARGCRECKTKQVHFISELQKVFDCYEPETRKFQIVPLIGSLTSFGNYDPQKTETNYLGVQIIQELLHFNKPIKIVDSILNLSNNELIKLLCDMKGCHVTDSYVDSPFVGEKSRERLFKKLQGQFVHLATSKYGSRSLDAIWKVIPMKLRIVMMEELKSQQSELMSNSYGSGFAYRTHLQSFRKNKDSWVQSMSATSTAEKFMQDVIPKKKFKRHDS